MLLAFAIDKDSSIYIGGEAREVDAAGAEKAAPWENAQTIAGLRKFADVPDVTASARHFAGVLALSRGEPEEATAHFAAALRTLDRVPDDAMFAVVGRLHVESMATMLGSFLADADRAKVLEAVADATRPFLESEDFAPLARGIGPDVGFWVTAPDPAEKTWCPQAILAVKVADGAEGKQAEAAAKAGEALSEADAQWVRRTYTQPVPTPR